MFASAAAAPRSLARVNPEFAEAVLNGLTQKGQKTIPPSWLYDEVGSALFEVITVLPEYGVTRAEAALLSHAADEIVRASARPARIVELGSGTGTKTRHILSAAARYQPVHYVPIDISPAALDNCAKALSGMENVEIEPIAATYLEGIHQAMSARKAGQPVLLLFLGSTIGNFTRTEAASFLTRIWRRMRPGDFLLLGADLVKSRERLISAYDDPIGVTASFNLNLLARINRELDGHFDVSQFAHEARYNERQSRIEMHLRSRVPQEVHIDALRITVKFAAGETIWTESSHKFRAEEISRIGQRSGFACVRQWVDGDWGFAETLFRKTAVAR
jgi:L-histidine Nalpha-methyltransferase